ncbi:hypothetical protein ACFT0E_37250, partial [Streptomyces sp. NPDC057052]
MPDTAAPADGTEAALLRRITAALAPEGPGRPLLLLVEGAAGTGKTRLLRRLAAGRTGTVLRTAPDGPLPDRGPVLLLVEDVHRAAPADTARLASLLADPPARLACVLSYRPEELPEPGLVLGLDTEFPSSLTVVRHVLGPLDVAAVRRMADHALGAARGTAGLADTLHRASGGVAPVVAGQRDQLAGGPPAPGRPHSAGPPPLGVPPP